MEIMKKHIGTFNEEEYLEIRAMLAEIVEAALPKYRTIREAYEAVSDALAQEVSRDAWTYNYLYCANNGSLPIGKPLAGAIKAYYAVRFVEGSYSEALTSMEKPI